MADQPGSGGHARVVYESRQNGSTQTFAGLVAWSDPDTRVFQVETPEGKTYDVDLSTDQVDSVGSQATATIGRLVDFWTGDEAMITMSEHQLKRMAGHLRGSWDRLDRAEGYFPEDYDPRDDIGEYGFGHDFTSVSPLFDELLGEINRERRRRREAGL